MAALTELLEAGLGIVGWEAFEPQHGELFLGCAEERAFAAIPGAIRTQISQHDRRECLRQRQLQPPSPKRAPAFPRPNVNPPPRFDFQTRRRHAAKHYAHHAILASVVA